MKTITFVDTTATIISGPIDQVIRQLEGLRDEGKDLGFDSLNLLIYFDKERESIFLNYIRKNWKMKSKVKLGDRYEKTSNPTIGHKYHLAWADHKCVWILKEISLGGKFCKLETPRTKKMIVAKVEDLRLLSKENPSNNYKPN